jgi:hypothetical protein
MPILKSWSFNITKEVYSSVGLYVEALSLKYVPLLIIAIGVSQIDMLRPFVPGHNDMDRHPHQLTFEDLTNPACNFSCDDHLGLDTFLLPDILTCFDVFNGQMLYYDTWVIHIIAPVQPRPFMYILLKNQFSRIWSTGPVRFLSVVNLEQDIFFRLITNDFCLLNCLSRDVHHFHFPAMRQFNPDNAQEIRKRADYPSDSCCGAILLRGMPHEFYYNRSGEWISTNLRPSMEKRLFNSMVQSTAPNSNFSRIWNRDLRSVVQHARVSFPCDPASDLSISGIPDA